MQHPELQDPPAAAAFACILWRFAILAVETWQTPCPADCRESPTMAWPNDVTGLSVLLLRHVAVHTCGPPARDAWQAMPGPSNASCSLPQAAFVDMLLAVWD